MQFVNLIKNEHMKQFKRPRVWVFITIMALMNLIVGIFFKYLFKGTEFTFWDYIHVSSYLLLVIQFMCIIIAGDSVANEFEKGTVKQLFTRPVKKYNILISKFLIVTYCVLLLTVLQFVMSAVFGLVFFASTLMNLSEQVLIGLGSYLFTFIEIVIICALAFCLSAITRSSILSIAISIFLVFTSNIVITLLNHYQYCKQSLCILTITANISKFLRNSIYTSLK
ncbi:ABC transporter permease [Metabacillus malikii]|uniref:ABC-2 type transport system permease protein n=1 Tax=Metabacillus malikii TaxID=1504265 RepID=A0ABT9ZPA5_9BACI|nr:ABC transporter permease [Metabacillus malikii]MDQ0233602.1 ABC-2 type transport system permease protein [Metabacillus malikii]